MKFSRKNFWNSSEQLTLIFLVLFSVFFPIIWINTQKDLIELTPLLGIWIVYGIWNYLGYSPRITIDDKGVRFKSHFKQAQIEWEDIRTFAVIKLQNRPLTSKWIDVTEKIPEQGDMWVIVSTYLEVDYNKTHLTNSNELIRFQYRENAYALIRKQLIEYQSSEQFKRQLENEHEQKRKQTRNEKLDMWINKLQSNSSSQLQKIILNPDQYSKEEVEAAKHLANAKHKAS